MTFSLCKNLINLRKTKRCELYEISCKPYVKKRSFITFSNTVKSFISTEHYEHFHSINKNQNTIFSKEYGSKFKILLTYIQDVWV